MTRNRSTCRQFTPPGQVARWIWRCHIDASRPNRAVWKYLETAISRYDAAIFSMPAFARPLACPMFLILPSIDPLSDKNCAIPESGAAGDACRGWASTRSGRCWCRSRGSIASRTRWA